MNFQQFSKAIANHSWKFITVAFEGGNTYNDCDMNVTNDYLRYEFNHDISESLHWISGCQFSQNHLANYFYLQLRDEKLTVGEETGMNAMGYCPTFLYIWSNGYKVTYNTTSGTFIMLSFEDGNFWWEVYLPQDRENGTHHFYLECLSKNVSEEALQTKYDLWQLEENNPLNEDKYNTFSKEWNEKVGEEYPPTLKGYKTKQSLESLAFSVKDYSNWCWKTPENRGKKQKAKKLMKEMEYLLNQLKEEYPEQEVVYHDYEECEGLEEYVEYEDFPEDDVE